jgi:hypothetical protein
LETGFKPKNFNQTPIWCFYCFFIQNRFKHML